MHPDAKLRVAGTGQLYDRATSLGQIGVAPPEFEAAFKDFVGSSKSEAEAKGVTFLGLVSPADLRNEAASATIGVVNPKVRGSVETFCVSAVEMQAAGLPVIGGNALGLKETVLNGETGILVNSEEHLLETILRLLSRPELTRRMGAAAQIWARNFSLDAVGPLWIDIITSVSSGKYIAPPRFQFNSAHPKTILREGIRQCRRVPWIRDKTPSSLSDLSSGARTRS